MRPRPIDAAEPLTVGDELRRCELDAARRCAQDLGNARLQGAEVDAVGMRLEQRERDGRLLVASLVDEGLARPNQSP